MAKQTTTQKEPVKLREKKLSNGNVSLFLDIYRNGKRHKEYLKLYLIDAKTPLEKEQNRQTLATAQAIKSKRLIEIGAVMEHVLGRPIEHGDLPALQEAVEQLEHAEKSPKWLSRKIWKD